MQTNRRSFLKSGAALLATGTVTGCATAARTDPAALRGNADALLRNAVASGDVAGVVAAATTREGAFYETAFGERVLGQGPAMNLDTVCWIASMTKPLVGAGVMQLVEQGRLDLDAPAGKLIPYLGEVQVLDGWDDKGEPRLRPARSPVTLRNLLTHTSGFVYDIWDPDIARYTKVKNLPRAGSGRNIALQIPLAFDPGARWEYGIGIDWAGKMLEAASGMRLGAYLRQNLFAPLGMDSTGFRISPEMRARLAKVHSRGADGRLTVTGFEVPQEPEFESGGGGIYSTAGDYLRFARMILNGGAGNGNRVLRADTVALMSKNNIGNLRVSMLKTQNAVLSRDAEFFIGAPKTWGLTFMINEEQAPTGRSAGSLAWAGLANTYMWIDPRRGVAGVYLTQILPFVDEKSFPLYLAFEKAVYQSLG
ncbi:MAG TPA: serine hydrolase domain-containing protein [Burkholderiales bacterium]|nr:serine hydrolase domain-containing protein [Burkholderiales bacterium]